MEKLYVYVDETGQDTEGDFFLVAVVIVAEDREMIREKLEQIEGASKKGLRKWFHTKRERRMAYIKEVIESHLFQEKIWYAHYTQTKAYLNLTILTIARAVLDKASRSYRATVLIDGLNKTERHRVGAGLRDLQVKVEKVRGLSEKADALIRSADAMAGFVRDALEGDQEMRQLFQRAVSRNVVKELK